MTKRFTPRAEAATSKARKLLEDAQKLARASYWLVEKCIEENPKMEVEA